MKERVVAGEGVVAHIVVGPREVVDDEEREHAIDQAHVRLVDGNETVVSVRIVRRLDMHDRRKELQEIVDAALSRADRRHDLLLRRRDQVLDRDVRHGDGTGTWGPLGGSATRIEGRRSAVRTRQPTR